MRRHIIGAFQCVFVIRRVFRHKMIKVPFHIAAHIRVCVLVDGRIIRTWDTSDSEGNGGSRGTSVQSARITLHALAPHPSLSMWVDSEVQLANFAEACASWLGCLTRALGSVLATNGVSA